MSQLDLRVPRASQSAPSVTFAVAGESSVPHAGWTQFVALVLERGLPHVATYAWAPTVLSVEPLAEVAVTTGRADQTQSALLALHDEGVDAWAYVQVGHGRFQATIGAGLPSELDAAYEWLRERVPEATAEDNRVPVVFWARGRYGGAEYSRSIDVPDWPAIAENYPSAVRGPLDEVLLGGIPTGGRLLLWHGPPGTGKTHVVRSLGWEWRSWCDLHYVTDPEEFFGSSEYMLEVLLNEDEGDAQERWRLLVLEDTGELLSADAKERTGQRLSRFLNVVDGIIGQGLRVLALVTTNEQLRRLHPAVSRPGRCASVLEFPSFPAAEAQAWLDARAVDAAEGPRTLAELFALAEGRSTVESEPRPIGFTASGVRHRC